MMDCLVREDEGSYINFYEYMSRNKRSINFRTRWTELWFDYNKIDLLQLNCEE